MGVNIELGNHSSKILDSDLIVKSPGVPNNIKIIEDALEKDIKVIGEIEFAYQLSDIKIIAVTGTNGKTTVVTALHGVLNQGFNVLKGGNIGIPFSQLVLENSLSQNHSYDYVVLEISSFQAEDIISFKPNIAIILNLSEDHLDVHNTYDSYKNAKLNLFKNMDKEDFAIYNLDDKNLNQSFEDIAKKTNVMTFSYGQNQDSQYKNLNHVAVAKVASLLDINEESIFNFLKDFKGLEHRFEIFKQENNITFINDSKSTNGLSIESALSNCIDLKINSIVLILGGKSKGIDYSSYIDSSSIDIKIVAYGEAAAEIKNKLPDYGVDVIKDFTEENNIRRLFALGLVKQQLTAKKISSLVDYELPRNRLVELLEKQKIEFVDTSKRLIEEHTHDNPIIFHDGHPNLQGHQVFSEIIFIPVPIVYFPHFSGLLSAAKGINLLFNP